MMQEVFSDETLMAYADGELDAEARAAVDVALETDTALQTRLLVFTQSRKAASDAFRPLLDEPVPDELSKTIAGMVQAHESSVRGRQEINAAQPDNVVSFDRKPRFAAPQLGMAMAASVALFVGGAIGYGASTWQSPPSQSGLVVAELSSSELPEALLTVASGDEIELEQGRTFQAIASFRDEAGRFCREFEVDRANVSSIVSVACRTGDQWHVQFTVVTASTGDAVVPASSLEALDAYLSATGAGEPLSEDDERAALSTFR